MIDLKQGDCLKIMKEIPDKSIDMIITDPPYSTPTITGFGRKQVKNVADLSIQETYMKCLKEEFERILKDNAPIFVFCDDKYYPSIYRAFYNWQSVQMIVWDKGKIGMGKPFRKRHELIVYANRETIDYNRTENITHYPTVLNYKVVTEKEKVHPTQKPIELLEYLIKTYSNDGETVLDNCMGSGSTGVACINTNRNFIGIELSEEYYYIAKERIEKASLEE